MINTPIILIIFNRPEETQKVFDVIRKVKPKKLIVIADGPRDKIEKIKCDETKKIIDTIDWPCEVIKDYSEKNIGVKEKIGSGLTSAFRIVDQAIIFESDCVPHPTFFPFCEKLLDMYKDDERVMHIGGNFFQHANQKFYSDKSYYFSLIPHIWGWATWARAWKYYDQNISSWPETRRTGKLRKILTNPAVYEYWESVWDQYYRQEIQSWDGQWTFACLMNNGVSIVPTKNLVTNIGFGPQALHNKNPNSIFANIPTEEMIFPLSHPQNIEINNLADKFTWKQNFGINRSLKQKILGSFRRSFPKIYYFLRNIIKKK